MHQLTVVAALQTRSGRQSKPLETYTSTDTLRQGAKGSRRKPKKGKAKAAGAIRSVQTPIGIKKLTAQQLRLALVQFVGGDVKAASVKKEDLHDDRRATGAKHETLKRVGKQVRLVAKSALSLCPLFLVCLLVRGTCALVPPSRLLLLLRFPRLSASAALSHRCSSGRYVRRHARRPDRPAAAH